MLKYVGEWHLLNIYNYKCEISIINVISHKILREYNSKSYKFAIVKVNVIY